MPHRVIITKHRIYQLAPDEQGVPVETYFSGQALELLQRCPLAGAKVYQTVDGPVIAIQKPPQPG